MSTADETGTSSSSTGLPPTSSGESTSDTESELSCPESLDACDAWFLPTGAMQWEPATIGGSAALRPEGPVLAAFDIETEQRGFVLTATDVSTFNLETRVWLERRLMSDVFPHVVDEEILSATSIPASWGQPDQDKIRLSSANVVYLYWYDTRTGVFDLQSIEPINTDDPGAPARSTVHARWFDTTNAPGWVQGSLEMLCGARGPVTVYAASVVMDSLYVRDLNMCGTYFPAEPYLAALPTSYPGAPEAGAVQGAIYNETTGLVLLTQ